MACSDRVLSDTDSTSYTYCMQNVAEMEALVERLHGGQMRRNGDSNALHVKRVAAVLESALMQTGERPERAMVLRLAALGHDLLEDTDIKKEEIKNLAGADALSLIEESTNTGGDTHTREYVSKMVAASEEARLIKYADLFDNTLHTSYDIRLLGGPWLHDYFLPIIDPMREALDLTNFEEFPKTAELLRTAARFARAHLSQSITAM